LGNKCKKNIIVRNTFLEEILLEQLSYYSIELKYSRIISSYLCIILFNIIEMEEYKKNFCFRIFKQEKFNDKTFTDEENSCRK